MNASAWLSTRWTRMGNSRSTQNDILSHGSVICPPIRSLAAPPHPLDSAQHRWLLPPPRLRTGAPQPLPVQLRRGLHRHYGSSFCVQRRQRLRSELLRQRPGEKAPPWRGRTDRSYVVLAETTEPYRWAGYRMDCRRCNKELRRTHTGRLKTMKFVQTN